MDDDSVILLLEDYKLDCTIPEYTLRNRKRVEECSLSRWAADELEIYILSHVDLVPIDACMKFIRQMSYYRRRYPKSQRKCDAAIDVANDILDILMCSGGYYYKGGSL